MKSISHIGEANPALVLKDSMLSYLIQPILSLKYYKVQVLKCLFLKIVFLFCKNLIKIRSGGLVKNGT